MTSEREQIVFRGDEIKIPKQVDLLADGASCELPPAEMLHTAFSGLGRNDFFTVNVRADGCHIRYDDHNVLLTKGETKKLFIREFPPGQYSWEEERGLPSRRRSG